MMPDTTVQALGQARLAELHHRAQRDALARGVRRARRDRRRQAIYRAPAALGGGAVAQDAGPGAVFALAGLAGALAVEAPP
jgi:hypothetical protein